MTEDLAVFFTDWGGDATLDGAPVRVLYGAPGSVLLGAGAALGIAVDQPRALIDAASIPARTTSPDTDPVLLFPGVTPQRPLRRFSVRETLPDGMGMATLLLAKHPNQA